MVKKGWLSLNEYASNHQVSVSTLRRRIKKDNLITQMVQGKYWVKDVPIEKHDAPKKMALNSEAPQHELRAEPNQDGLESLSQASQNTDCRPPTLFSDTSTESVLAITQDLLGELKKAYMQVLQEKEEQILILKSEIGDLQTLVSALESDNERLREEIVNEKSINSKKEISRLSFIERHEKEDEAPHPIVSSESWLELE